MNAKSYSRANPGADTTPLFQLGAVVATRGALDLLERAGMDATAYVTRHQTGDSGTLSPPDLHGNHVAISYGHRIFSAYDIGRERLWLVTEADRSATTLLLPSEY